MLYVSDMFWARQNDTVSHQRESAADQPRPALGRRPWFALLRRARSLRRFALAIRRQSVAASRCSLTLVDHDDGWSTSPVFVARSRRERLFGVKLGIECLLLHTRAVHGRGLQHALQLAAIDGVGKVLSVRTLAPGAFVRLPDAMWTLELPIDTQPPVIGGRISIYARCRDGETDSLCHSDWQSGRYDRKAQDRAV